MDFHQIDREGEGWFLRFTQATSFLRDAACVSTHLPLEKVPAGPRLLLHLADVVLQELGGARPLAVLLRVEPVQVALAPAVVEGHASLLRVVKVPANARLQDCPKLEISLGSP